MTGSKGCKGVLQSCIAGGKVLAPSVPILVGDTKGSSFRILPKKRLVASRSPVARLRNIGNHSIYPPRCSVAGRLARSARSQAAREVDFGGSRD